MAGSSLEIPKMATASERRTYDVEEAGRMLGISRNAAYAAVKDGTIPSIKIGPKRIVVPKAAFDRLLDGDDPSGDLTPRR
jgi:excisionase family DNA binding protein